MGLFRIKRRFLEPYVRYMRRRERDQPALAKHMLEAQYFRPTFYRWIKAIVVDRDLLHSAPLDPESIVVDVGAHRGDWSARIHELYGCRLVMYEMDPPSVDRLKERFAGEDWARLFEFGLHDEDDRLELVQKGPGSTVFAGSPGEQNFRTVTVPLRDVARCFDELRVERVDLLKVNIEGGEYPVLERLLEVGWMRRIRYLLVQFHEWPDRAYYRRWRIRRGLRRTHELVWDYPFVWEKWRLREQP